MLRNEILGVWNKSSPSCGRSEYLYLWRNWKNTTPWLFVCNTETAPKVVGSPLQHVNLFLFLWPYPMRLAARWRMCQRQSTISLSPLSGWIHLPDRRGEEFSLPHSRDHRIRYTLGLHSTEKDSTARADRTIGFGRRDTRFNTMKWWASALGPLSASIKLPFLSNQVEIFPPKSTIWCRRIQNRTLK